jgi:2-polyprenyl-6-methoxyphenol hydroxylase-like FAD-dependent oxidoreductase
MASRPTFEATLRRLTLERSNIQLVDGHEVTGFLVEGSAVAGVRIRARLTRGSVPDEHGPGYGKTADAVDSQDLHGWLIIDASGRESRTSQLLRDAGFDAPAETVIDASLRYATRIYRMPDAARSWKALLVRDRPPAGTRGGVITPIEGGRWLVTLGGAGADQPPTDPDSFLEFASTLVSPILVDAIRDAEPIGPVRGWARTANRWRHVETMRRWPAGLALIGDALCALNPVYGQGMSVAAMEGPVLAGWLSSVAVRRSRAVGSPPETMGLMRALARTARLPWFLAAAEDARIPGATGAVSPGLVERVARRYVDAVYAQAARHQPTTRRFSEVTQLVRPPIALFDPVVALEVAQRALRTHRVS